MKVIFSTNRAERWVPGRALRGFSDAFWNGEGSQLLEFALAIPFLIVFVVGIFDFGEVYNLKQKLNNSSREAARFASSENSGTSLNTSDVNAVRDVVSTYLTNAGVTQCAIGATPAVAGFIYTYNSSSTGCGGGNFALVIDREYVMTANGRTVAGTHVTLTYPFNWTIGKMIGFMLPSSTLNAALPAKISTDSVMQNLN